ncbi:hypothetical protein DSLASN_47590 [Desulfoluna limicola]|uniref:Uncharacterized protein n=1 Tax=Desulfoluna limicola TaxID=2810562 RepID=A0ABM7PPQ1_9BACT|nr:hypothetical protein DSLASN_47590 [Desulfoluna limicola]
MEALQERKSETCRFAGTRLGSGENIATLENEWDCLFLDRGSLLVALICDSAQQFG